MNGIMYVRPGNGWKPHQNLHVYGKIDVNGENHHPLYEFLKVSQQRLNMPGTFCHEFSNYFQSNRSVSKKSGNALSHIDLRRVLFCNQFRGPTERERETDWGSVRAQVTYLLYVTCPSVYLIKIRSGQKKTALSDDEDENDDQPSPLTLRIVKGMYPGSVLVRDAMSQVTIDGKYGEGSMLFA